MAARIPLYQRQVGTPRNLGPGPTGGLPYEVSTADVIGRAAGDLAQVGSQFVQKQKQKEEEDAAAWSAEQLGKARLEWTQQQINREENAAPGAPNYRGQLEKDFDEYSSGLIQQAPTESARRYLSERMTSMKTGIIERGMVFEAKSRIADRESKITSAVDQGRIAVDLDPSQYASVLGENLATLSALDIPEARKRELADGAKQALSFASVSSRMRQDPSSVLQQLGSDDGGGALDVGSLNADNRIRLRNQAEAELKRRESEARQAAAISRAEMSFRLNDAQAAYMQGLEYENPPTAVELQSIYGKDKGQQVFNSLSKAQQFGTDVQEFATLPIDQRMDWLKQRQPGAGGVAGEGFAEDAKLYGQLIKNAQSMNDQLANDGAGYAIKYAPQVAQAWQGVMSADDESAPAAYQAYAEAVRGEQARLGIQKPTILPASYVSQMAAAFKDPANQGPRQIEMIESMKSTWGQFYPDAFQQISRELPNSVKIIGSGVDRDTATLLSTIAGTDTKTLKAALPTESSTMANNELKASLAPLQQTFAAQGASGISTFDAIYQEAYRGALYQISQGKDPSDAAQDMTSRLSQAYTRDGTLQVDGTLRVPRDWDIDTIQDGITSAVDALPIERLRIDGIESVSDEFKASRFNAMKGAMYVQTNRDETGVYLMHNGGAVLDSDGNPVQFSFDELAGMSVTKPKPFTFQKDQ